jgi:hypothetical protein
VEKDVRACGVEIIGFEEPSLPVFRGGEEQALV